MGQEVPYNWPLEGLSEGLEGLFLGFYGRIDTYIARKDKMKPVTRPALVRYFYTRALDLALEEVEGRARKVLQEYPHKYTSFLMGNGRAFFVTVNDDTVDRLDAVKELKPTFNFIDKWDRFLFLSGIPLNVPKRTKE